MLILFHQALVFVPPTHQEANESWQMHDSSIKGEIFTPQLKELQDKKTWEKNAQDPIESLPQQKDIYI